MADKLTYIECKCPSCNHWYNIALTEQDMEGWGNDLDELKYESQCMDCWGEDNGNHNYNYAGAGF